MDIGTAIIGAALVVACVLPFLWLHSIRKKAAKKLLKLLTDFATEHNGFISRHEICRDMAIGLDERTNDIFFYKKSNAEEIAQHIEFATIKTCKVVNTSKTFTDKDGAHTMVEKLELCFVPIAEHNPTIALEFYDMHKNLQLSGELQFVERWAKWVNERLKQAK